MGWDIPFIETSAKEATNVREAFECVARRALKCQDSESELLYPTLTPVNLEDTEIILHSPQHSHQPSVSINTSSPEASHSTNSDCC
ncbi:hypothetical protein Pelo_19744 [Pelomyxa schiedti]|nr:hypothetical protein Pelo_19744 [Pelomyxa schiedti]